MTLTKEQMKEYQRQRRLQKKAEKEGRVLSGSELVPCPACAARKEEDDRLKMEIEMLKKELAELSSGKGVIKNKAGAELVVDKIVVSRITSYTVDRPDHKALCPCTICRFKRGEIKEPK